MRELDDSGELRASRTKGGHRRFSRKALDAYLARKGSGGTKRTQERPKPRWHAVARPGPVPEPLDDDTEDFEPGDAEFEPFVEEPPPPSLNPLEKFAREFAREIEERRKREKDEAPLRRLAILKQYGLNQIGWGVPDSGHARVAAALESYVTLKTFPAWVSDVDAYRIVRGKVEETLQPYHDEVARKKAEEARMEEEARNERRVKELIEYGKRHASSEIPFDWAFEDRGRAARDVERMLDESVEADWSEQDVKDAVNDELHEWEDNNLEDDEEDES